MLMFKNRVVKNLEVDNVDMRDFPDFCDACFSYAEFENGTPLTDSDNDQVLVYLTPYTEEAATLITLKWL